MSMPIAFQVAEMISCGEGEISVSAFEGGLRIIDIPHVSRRWGVRC
jgi:hypothetical protein